MTLEQIKKEYDENIFYKNKLNVFKEYLQYELLDSIFKQKGSENLSFIGGTAIRIVYGSNRFSEDLDFDNFGLNFRKFEEVLNKTIQDMNKKGFNIEFKFVEKGAYHCYIKFPELLAKNDLSQHIDEKLLIRIDAVSKKKEIATEINILNKFNVYKKIIVNPVAVILSQKMFAILNRKRTKGRDFYDVSYLLGLTQPDYTLLKKLGIHKNNLKKELLEKTADLDFKKLSLDVMPFLINPNDTLRITDFRNYIEKAL